MLPEESKLLQDTGHKLLIQLAEGITSTLLYGIFILLFSISTVTFSRPKGLDTRPLKVMFFVTVITFLITTMDIAARVAASATFIQALLVDNSTSSLDARLDLSTGELVVPQVIFEWTTTLLSNISDIVVIWRAWVLFPERRWVMIAPLIMMLASLVTAFTFFSRVSSASGIATASVGTSSNLYLATLGLSMAANAVPTFLAAYKLMTYRKTIVIGRWSSPVHNILFILVESGAVYCCVQLLYFILSSQPHLQASFAGHITMEVTCALYSGLSALYPTVIIVLVNSQCSYTDTYVFSSAPSSIQSSSSGERCSGHPSSVISDCSKDGGSYDDVIVHSSHDPHENAEKVTISCGV